MRRILALLFAAGVVGAPAAAATYHDNAALDRELSAVARRGGFELTGLVRDRAGDPIRMVRAGSGDPSHPAVLLVAGLDGRHLVGTEMALALLAHLADHPDSVDLSARTLYVVPRVNRHGAAAFFGDPRREIAGLAGRSDSDRDGLTAEDEGDDLNGDGLIGAVRVEHPDGDRIAAGEDGMHLRLARPEAGERGTWLLLTEGRDDDGDEAWNEEEDGGVNAARNFTHGYAWFERDTGPHQVSEPETRALADFIAAHPNLVAVVVFGFEDNLLVAPGDKTSDPALGGSRFGRKPVTEPNVNDLPWIRELGERYRESLGLKGKEKELGAVVDRDHAASGGLAAYAYYARGRLGLATPVWTPGLQLAWAAAADTSEGGDDGDIDEAIRAEHAFRRWLQANHPQGWLGWTPVEHPDFPGRRAEIGGFAPFARINPPPSELDRLAAAHTGLLTDLLGRLPRVRVRDASLEARSGGVHELLFTVENAGGLPDVLAQGVVSTHVRPTRVEIELPAGGSVLGGPARFALDRLDGNGGHRKSVA